MTSPSSTARLRTMLTAWSDDDDDETVPKRIERSVSLPALENGREEGREVSHADPSPKPVLPARNRIPRAPCLDSDDDDDEEEEEEESWKVKVVPRKVDPVPLSPKARSSRDAGSVAVFSPPGHRSYSPASRSLVPASVGPALQAPIQPGCTEFSAGKSRFLAYNMLGSISSVESQGFAHVEVDFHDISRGMRVPSMTDYFGFTMAAMNEKGSVFANPQKGEKIPSTIMYRPFNSWTNNSEWSMRFNLEEEVEAVAIGSSWAAAATSQHFLRVYTEAGLQKFVLSLAGPVVALAGHGDQLAVVIHASNPLPSGDQILEYMLLNVSEQRKLLAGRLPLSPASTLKWLGFTDAGSLSSYDSQGILRVYSNDYDGCWIPVFSAAAERKKEKDNYWVVGLNTAQVFCVVCKAPDTEPQVVPKPVLSVINTTVPVVHSDLGADDLESDFLMGTLHLTQTRFRADEAAAASREDPEADEAVLKMETELDRCLLRLIAAACKGDKLARALELSNQLSLHKSMEGALKLVTTMRLPSLAERINQLLEERIAKERAEEAGAYMHRGQAQVAYTGFTPYRDTGNSVSEQPQPQTFPSPVEISNIRDSERGSDWVVSTSNTIRDSSSGQPSSTRPFQSVLKKSHKRVTADAEPKLPPEEGSSGEDSQAASLKAATVPQGSFVSLTSIKASNPFAKKMDDKLNADDKNDSILQSLKKMQHGGNEPDGKRKVGAIFVNSQQRPVKIGKTG